MGRGDNIVGGGFAFLMLFLFSWTLNPVVLGGLEQISEGEGLVAIVVQIGFWFASFVGVCYNVVKLAED